ncbi:MAG TPA: cyclase family protein [Acidimicrobiales bacterium]
MSATVVSTWWPSRYGAEDEAGALNEIGPDNVVGAARLVRSGRVYDLAHVLHMDVPAFEGRLFCQELDAPQSVPGSHGLGFVIERVHAPSQMGTHMDGLNHLHKDGRTYNGHRIADISAPYGTTKLGADRLPQVATRGVLVDVAARRGVERLDAGDVITPDDVTEIDVRPGDAVLFHTGWGRMWHEDPDGYGAGEPGPGMALARWLADHRVALTGCDTWSYGPVPAEDPDQPFVVPQTLNTQWGVVVVENLYLQELARDGVHEFLLVVAHPKLSGATGAWVTPLAIV